MNSKLILLVLFAMLLAACGGQTPAPAASSPTPGELVPSPTATLPPAATLPPPPTDTPLPLTVLLAPAGSDTLLADELEARLRPALEQAGLRLERWSSVGDLPAELRLLAALPPDPGLAALAAAAPQAQFLAIGIPGLAPAPNLSLVGPDGPRPDQQAFMAGVVAAMITYDWRVGVLSETDSPAGMASRQGFVNGAIYFCGLCLPYHGPIVDYPTFATAPAGASPAEWQTAVQSLLDDAVQTVYIAPQVTDPAAWEALGQSDVTLIGGTPPPSGLQARWAVSLLPDPSAAVLELLPQLLAGQGSQVRPLPLRLAHANPALFSPGKQMRAEEILADLLAGYIDPGIQP